MSNKPSFTLDQDGRNSKPPDASSSQEPFVPPHASRELVEEYSRRLGAAAAEDPKIVGIDARTPV